MHACPTAQPFSRLAVAPARPPSQGNPALPPLHTHFPPLYTRFPPPPHPCSHAPALAVPAVSPSRRCTPAFPRRCTPTFPRRCTRFPPPLYPLSPRCHTRVPMRSRPPFRPCRHARRVHLHGPSLAWPSHLPAPPSQGNCALPPSIAHTLSPRRYTRVPILPRLPRPLSPAARARRSLPRRRARHVHPPPRAAVYRVAARLHPLPPA
ncbi:hypothetical protein B0H14DRAFT_3516010 [Mycena olivaceomarginata]|nr:hypothetical protein B0H14DRAFT_3516010 [Mycena olivaceomarginata]